MIGQEIETLIKTISRLPGLGSRSARRIALFLVKNRNSQIETLVSALKEVQEKVKICPICGNYDTLEPCSICSDNRRDEKTICIVQDVADLWAMERTSAFKGKYHILGGVLSALDGIGPEDLGLDKLHQRVQLNKIEEIVLALPATVDGQTTSHYIAEIMRETGVKVSSLAHGVPVGGELDYLDDGTIQTALKARYTL